MISVSSPRSLLLSAVSMTRRRYVFRERPRMKTQGSNWRRYDYYTTDPEEEKLEEKSD